jgi:hypothetical protein
MEIKVSPRRKAACRNDMNAAKTNGLKRDLGVEKVETNQI